MTWVKKAEGKKQYSVIFSFSFEVDAEDEKEAEILGREAWDELTPRTDEMNIEVVENGPAGGYRK